MNVKWRKGIRRIIIRSCMMLRQFQLIIMQFSFPESVIRMITQERKKERKKVKSTNLFLFGLYLAITFFIFVSANA